MPGPSQTYNFFIPFHDFDYIVAFAASIDQDMAAIEIIGAEYLGWNYIWVHIHQPFL